MRPQALAPHPDGRQVAFIGPPEEVGGGRAEHNVYNKQIWLLDLADGSFRRVTTGLRYAFAGARNLPAWRDGGRRLVAPANAGGRELMVSLDTRPDPWEAEELPQARDVGGAWSLSPDADWVAFTATDPETPPDWLPVDQHEDWRVLWQAIPPEDAERGSAFRERTRYRLVPFLY